MSRRRGGKGRGAIVLDAGALIQVESNDRIVVAMLERSRAAGIQLRTHPMVIGQVWRTGRGKQVRIARLLKAVTTVRLEEKDGKAAGELVERAGTNDPIDAAVVNIARDGDRILTTDPYDIQQLVNQSGKVLEVVKC